jgi:CGNR zinc finger
MQYPNTPIATVNLQVQHLMDLSGSRTVRVSRRGSEIYFRLGRGKYDPEPPLDEVMKPPHEVTNAFLAIASVEDAARFLGQYGPLHQPDTATDPCTVKWSDLLKIQNDLRKMWTTRPGTWHEISKEYLRQFEAAHTKLHFDFRWDPPILLTMSTSVVEALIADLTLSALSGLESAFCARSDCQKLFQKTSNHDRKYCSTECAHVESVRKHRARKSADKKKGK